MAKMAEYETQPQITKHNRGSQSTEKKWGNTTKQDQKREQEYTKHNKK